MANRDLLRGRPKRVPLVRFFVYCEGRNTEPNYLETFARHVGHRQVVLEVDTPGGIPAILKAAKEKKKELRAQNADVGTADQVWVVFDEDGRLAYAAEVAQCLADKINVATSNSCFELWLIAHHANEAPTTDQQAVCARLAALDSSYNSNNKMIDAAALMPHVETAEAVCRANLEQAQIAGAPFRRGTTYVGKLTAAIRKAATAFARKFGNR
jgi:hypothetical protein